jgi:cell division protein ZapA (FtsZ GTPase activity inhibitor)
MSQEPIAVSVRILDKEYRVSCGPDEEEGLRESARMLDQRMREIRQTGRVIGVDRIAVMAALNIAYELIQSRWGGNRTSASACWTSRSGSATPSPHNINWTPRANQYSLLRDIPCGVRERPGYFLEPNLYPGGIMMKPLRMSAQNGKPEVDSVAPT